MKLPSAILILLGTIAATTAEVPVQRVGQLLEIREVYIPGGAVKPKPRRDNRPPLSVRLLQAKPAADGGRYDFEIQGLDPGTYDLADFLEAPDGTVIPSIPLEITAGLTPGPVRPHRIPAGDLPELGGYRQTMTVIAILWAVGLAAIIFWRRKKSGDADDVTEAAPSLSDRLRPLVARASVGDLSAGDRARLERLVIGHWRERRPDIAALTPAEAMVQLRADPEASPLVLALERWLHAREANTSEADLASLLAPYQ
jgi:hypothetical protein